MRAGVNLNEIDDLKSYLATKMKQGKQTHNTPMTAVGEQQNKAKKVA